MTIKITLLKNPGFTTIAPLGAVARDGVTATQQNQNFQNFQLQNGYGSATSVSISPGYGATVSAHVSIKVTSVTEQTFNQIIDEVKKSSTYQNHSQFKHEMDSATYSSAGSVSAGIFGWLLGGGSQQYTNQSSRLTDEINQYNEGSASDDVTVANSVANIMLKNSSEVSITSDILVTGQLLTPSPTVIAVETTTFKFTDSAGNTSSVSMLNQSPLVPVDVNSGTVSNNTVAPGSKLNVTPIGG